MYTLYAIVILLVTIFYQQITVTSIPKINIHSACMCIHIHSPLTRDLHWSHASLFFLPPISYAKSCGPDTVE